MTWSSALQKPSHSDLIHLNAKARLTEMHMMKKFGMRTSEDQVQGWTGSQDRDAKGNDFRENAAEQIDELQQTDNSDNSIHGNMNQLKLAGFDDDNNWCDEQAVAAEEHELSLTSLPKAAQIELVSPLIRSIFEGRKKLIDATQRGKKDQGGAGVIVHSKQVAQREKEVAVEQYEETLHKKVEALDEEITIFKKESKRLKNLAKENEEGLTRLARERAEWEQQKKTQMQAFQAQQEEQTEKLKKEKQILEHRSASLLGLPAVQRKEVEELKATLAKQQEEHRGKETRLRLTISRMRAMNEDLTRQVLELREEIQRYESCLLAALDGREQSGSWQVRPVSKKPCGEANYKHMNSAKQLYDEAMGDKRSKTAAGGRQRTTAENLDTSGGLTVNGVEPLRSKLTPGLLSEQAKLLSDLFSRPWKATRDCATKEEAPSGLYVGQCNSNLSEWR